MVQESLVSHINNKYLYKEILIDVEDNKYRTKGQEYKVVGF